jgi:hypothetical protein
MHIVLWARLVLEHQSPKRGCATQAHRLGVIEYHLNPANVTIWKHERVAALMEPLESKIVPRYGSVKLRP